MNSSEKTSTGAERRLVDAPCKNCLDREVGCHGSCDKYIIFKETRAQIRMALYKDGDTDHTLFLIHKSGLKNLHNRKKIVAGTTGHGHTK